MSLRIGLTGGGTGGHFYPLMAIAEHLREHYKDTDISLFYFGPEKYSEKELETFNIQYVSIAAGKRRLYYSFSNVIDIFRILWGVVQALVKLAIIYPDVIFSKGGFAAYPTLLAARILFIPVVIHDSDTIPGRVTLATAKFAKLIGVAWPECGTYLVTNNHIKESKIYLTGIPTRKMLNPLEQIKKVDDPYALETFIDKSLPLISIIGGSQGSTTINEAIIACLPKILPHAQVIHQTGKNNFEHVRSVTDKLLDKMMEKNNYLPIAYLNERQTRDIYSNSSIMIIRAGSTTIHESYMWGVPTIAIPIDPAHSRDQNTNAYASMARGASIVIEEKNFTPHILENEVLKVLKDGSTLAKMSASARSSALFSANEVLSKALVQIADSHV
jgi:UDP-N-acetylglucosamine--N-acetylmuramyl-(pentapeptide) pyrophosphoryl-undecaprenol N-acetylglucosamine transferase